MFITDRELGLEQFLKALSFIPPQGTTIKYFISPRKIELPEGAGFSEIENSPDETITYVRSIPMMKIDQASTPDEYLDIKPPKLGRRAPEPNLIPKSQDAEELGSPFMKVINESIDGTCDLKLLKEFGPFPKNTLFHCKEIK